jgi:hypothetical protein
MAVAIKNIGTIVFSKEPLFFKTTLNFRVYQRVSAVSDSTAGSSLTREIPFKSKSQP